MRRIPFGLCVPVFMIVLVMGCVSPDTMEVFYSGDKDNHDSLVPRAYFLSGFGTSKYLASDRRVSPDGNYVLARRLNTVMMTKVDEEADVIPYDTEWQRLAPDGVTSVRYRWDRKGRFVILQTQSNGGAGHKIQIVDTHNLPEERDKTPPVHNLTPGKKSYGVIVEAPPRDPEALYAGIKRSGDSKGFDLYRIELDTGIRELKVKSNGLIDLWAVDSEGRVRMARQQNRDGSKEFLSVNEKDGLGEPFYQCEWTDVCLPVRLEDEGRILYFKSNKGNTGGLLGLHRFNLETGERKLVHVDPEREVDLDRAVFSERNGRLLATAYETDRLEWYPQTSDMEDALEFLRDRFGKVNLDLRSQSSKEPLLLVRVSSDVDPGKTYLFNYESNNLTELFDYSISASDAFSEMTFFQYQSRDGMEIPAYLTVPKGKEASDLPVIALIHGGPWNRASWGFDARVQFLANRGYAVFQPNFRGSRGYGDDFLNAGNGEWGKAMQDDITDGLYYLIEQGIADPNRICIMGASYGGYAALAGLAFTPELYECGISLSGPSNLVSTLKGSRVSPSVTRADYQMRVGDYGTEEGRRKLRQVSPYFHAEQVEAPLLVIHGNKDVRVRECESSQMVKALDDAGKSVEYLRSEKDGHSFFNKRNRTAVYARIEAFLAEHLGGRHQNDMIDPVRKRLSQLRVAPETLEAPACSQ